MSLVRKLSIVLLAAAVLATSGGWAAAEPAAQPYHGDAQVQAQPAGPAGEQGSAAGNGCAAHLSAHFFAPVNCTAALGSVIPKMPPVPAAPAFGFSLPSDSFFRPPRVSPV